MAIIKTVYITNVPIIQQIIGPNIIIKYKKEKVLLEKNLAQVASPVSVIIPAYNEEKTIGNVIGETINVMDNRDLPYEIIVVDDGSTDKTGRIASQYKATLLTNKTNMGKGYCLRRGFQRANGDIIVTIDSDGEHQPKEIVDLLEPILNGIDLVAGSRFLGESRNFTTRLNGIGNNLFNISIKLLTGTQITDSQSGFRAIKKEVLDAINLESDGYEIETEITVKSIMKGFRFQERPITCQRRRYSTSKIKILKDGTKIVKTIISSSIIAHASKHSLDT
jgi:glycosyltransferase involved in cell wall biosynthesis